MIEKCTHFGQVRDRITDLNSKTKDLVLRIHGKLKEPNDFLELTLKDYEEADSQLSQLLKADSDFGEIIQGVYETYMDEGTAVPLYFFGEEQKNRMEQIYNSKESVSNSGLNLLKSICSRRKEQRLRSKIRSKISKLKSRIFGRRQV